jgi:hypothetical protein
MNGTRLKRLAGPAVIALAAAAAVAPLLLRGTSCGHDFDFHLVSWFDCVRSWRAGIAYPHWAESANYGAGEPRFVFYPPLTWMLGAALGLALPWTLVPATMTFLLLAATGMATRVLARELMDDGAATLAGCAAVFSGYSLFTAYERSAFGEMTGGFWIPLLLLFALREKDAAGSVWQWTLDGAAALAVVVAGCWLSNPPLGVMACYLLAAVAVLAAAMRRSWAPVLRAGIAGALGMGAAAVYLVPAAVEQKWIAVGQAVDDAGERIENSWLFARHADPALALHDTELRRVSIIAVVMVGIAVVGLALAWRQRKLREQRKWWVVLAAVVVGILFLQFPASLPVWNLLPKMRFMQFPWRWLVALEAPMGIALAAAVWPQRGRARWAVAVACAAVFAGATVFAGTNFFQVCDDQDAVLPMASVDRSGVGFVGTDEYAPPGADNTLVAMGLPAACLVSDPETALGAQGAVDQDNSGLVWNAGQQSCEESFEANGGSPEHWRIAGQVERAGYLVLRLRSYPAWRVRVNGRAVTARTPRPDGLMAVPVEQGPVELAVDWTETADTRAGRWLSGLAVLALMGLGLWKRRRNRTHLS